MATPSPTASGSSTRARQVIGPLTTQFSPPNQCSQCTFLGAATDPAATIYSEECAIFNVNDPCPSQDPPACLPHVTSYSDVAGPGFFYSPGLFCPDGWSTAATVTPGTQSGDFVNGIGVATLLSDETAVVCCPTDFTYVSAGDVIAPGRCTKGVTTNGASYSSCAGDKLVAVTKTNVGDSTSISYQRVRTDGVRYLKTTTLLFTSVELSAPTIQLNYRPQDLDAASSHTSDEPGASTTTSSNEPGGNMNNKSSSSSLSGGAIAGIVIGIVALLIGACLLFLLRRRRRRAQVHPHEASTSDSNGAYNKPELEATQAALRLPPFAFPERQVTQNELAGDSQRFELDGSTSLRYANVMASDGAQGGGHTRNNLSDASAVSALSGETTIQR